MDFTKKQSSNVTLKLSLEDKKLLWTTKSEARHQLTAKGKDNVSWSGDDLSSEIKYASKSFTYARFDTYKRDFRIDESDNCSVLINIVRHKTGFRGRLKSKATEKQFSMKLNGKEIHSELERSARTVYGILLLPFSLSTYRFGHRTPSGPY